MLFKDIPGKEEIKNRLIRSVKDNRISHAQLFYGPEGCGKLAMVLAYTRYISCLNRGEIDSCGTCSSCVKYNKLEHPDLHFAFPVSAAESKDTIDETLKTWRSALLENPYLSSQNWYEMLSLENTQGSISTREGSKIINKLNLKSYESQYKVMIMWLPERMHIRTANKLLKTIEEPPPFTLFLLVSENPDDLIPTIRSRVQGMRIPKFKDSEIRKGLVERTTADDNLIEDAVKLGNGNFNLALSYITAHEFTKINFDCFVSLMRLSYAKNVSGLIKWVDEVSKLEREKQKSFLHYAIRMVRENFMVNINKGEITHMAGYESDFSTKFSRFVNSSNTELIYCELNEAFNHISANGNAKIVFFDMSLKMIKFLHL